MRTFSADIRGSLGEGPQSSPRRTAAAEDGGGSSPRGESFRYRPSAPGDHVGQGRYLLMEPLGRGAYGMVFKARRARGGCWHRFTRRGPCQRTPHPWQGALHTTPRV